MRTVAIVGFADVSLFRVHESNADEVWTMNHAYKVDEFPRKPDGTLQITRLFEIHKEDWFRRGSIPEHEAYWEWLKQPHDFQIVMQDVHPEVPCSVKYPFDEIVEMCFSHLLRKHGKKEIRETYFTNSFDYMLALAVYEGYTRVEPYGIEMDTNTEYAYQKPGASYHIGFAVARGVDMVLPEESGLCKSKLYGYEAVPAVTPEELKRYSDYYNRKECSLKEKYATACDVYNENHEDIDLYEEMRNAGALYNTYLGAKNLSDRFSGWIKDYLSRQNIEQLHIFFLRNLDKAQASLNVKQGRYDGYAGEDQDEKQRLFNEMIAASAEMYAQSGAVQFTKKLMGECDMKVGDPELIVDRKMNRRE